jgi:hypothetical protein
MMSRILHKHPDVLSVSEFFATMTIVSRRFQFPTEEMDGNELWKFLAGTEPFFDAVIRDSMNVPELCYPFDRGRYSPGTGVPMICNMTLPMITDDPDTLFDRMAAEVTTWPRRRAADHYRALFEWLADEMGGRREIVERSGNSMTLIPLMRQEFPDARFVLMHRDGPDCALSMSRHPAFRRGALARQAASLVDQPVSSWEEFEPLVPQEFKGLVIPPFDGKRIMEHEIPVSFFGDIWSMLVQAGLTALADLPAETWTSIKYEDLLVEPEQELTRLAAFIGVTATPEWLASARRLVDPRRAGRSAQMDPGVLASLRDACAPGNEALASALAG